jgi:hypothetical protein
MNQKAEYRIVLLIANQPVESADRSDIRRAARVESKHANACRV